MFSCGSRRLLAARAGGGITNPGNFASSSFSTSAPSSSRRQVLVRLLEDVDGLGYQSDQILVTPGRARNQLIPTGQARFVPWKRPADRVPWRSQAAVPSPSLLLQAAQRPSTSSVSPELLITLQSLPESIDFPLRTTSPTSSTVYGSVTIADITRILEGEFNVSPSDVEIKFRGLGVDDRIKELGRYEVDILPKGSDQPVVLRIDVTRAR